MNDLIRDLELSTRVANILEKMGVDTMEKFLNLDMRRFKGQKGIGRRSVNEVLDLQAHFRRITRIPTEEELEAEDFVEFRKLIRAANQIMKRRPHFFAMVVERETLLAVRADPRQTTRRYL